METAMTSQGHVTTALLKQAHKEDNREVFFIRLYLRKFGASILAGLLIDCVKTIEYFRFHFYSFSILFSKRI